METWANRTRWREGWINDRWIIGRERTWIRLGIRDRRRVVVQERNSTRHDRGGGGDGAMDRTQAQSLFKRLMESRDLVRSVFPHDVSSLPSRSDFSIERTAPSRLRTAQHRSQVALAMAQSASTAPRHDVTGVTLPAQTARGATAIRDTLLEGLDRVPNGRPLALARRWWVNSPSETVYLSRLAKGNGQRATGSR
jgi:hypothetical protein